MSTTVAAPPPSLLPREEPLRTMVRADYVLIHQRGGHALLRNGEICYSGDRIDFVGRGYDGPVDERLDFGRSLVTPGLIDLDALTDIDHLLLDSWRSADRADGLIWSQDWFEHRRRDVFTREERLAIREYALVQLALHGITTFMPIAAETHSAWAESCDELVGMADIARRLGLRAFLGPSYRSGVNVVAADGHRDVLFDEDRGREGFADAVRFLDHCDGLADPLITGVLLPCRIETLTIELLRETAALAARRDVLVRIHALQSLLERELIQRRHGMTPLDLLERTGLLNERLLVPHASYTDRCSRLFGEDRGDLARLAASGMSVVHCPLTSMRLGWTLQSFDAYRAAGINISLGTDSFPPDLIRGMDAGVHLAKIVEGRLDAGPAEHYVEAATLGGARALRRPDLGRLEVGAQADLVVFALDDIRDGVIDDPIRTLLLNGTARQVTHSVVAGRTVVRDGRIPGVDETALASRAQSLFATMRSAYSERDHARRVPAELFPPAFPPADL
jgi:cytosine/adenosine deaminase-related metal-dependent hydrolase